MVARSVLLLLLLLPASLAAQATDTQVFFDLLRGPEAEDHTLYASHSVWQSREHFEDWTKSEAFRKAHANAGGSKDIYQGHPAFEGFETVL